MADTNDSTGADAKVEELLHLATLATNMAERSRLIDEAVYGRLAGLEANNASAVDWSDD